MATVERVSHVASGVRVSGRARVRVYLECPVSLVSGTTHCPAVVLMTAAMTAAMTAQQQQRQR